MITRKSFRGFTIIEILLVVFIMGLTLSIIVSNFNIASDEDDEVVTEIKRFEFALEQAFSKSYISSSDILLVIGTDFYDFCNIDVKDMNLFSPLESYDDSIENKYKLFPYFKENFSFKLTDSDSPYLKSRRIGDGIYLSFDENSDIYKSSNQLFIEVPSLEGSIRKRYSKLSRDFSSEKFILVLINSSGESEFFNLFFNSKNIQKTYKVNVNIYGQLYYKEINSNEFD